MIAYPDYKTATNAADKMLAERDHISIETNVFAMAEQLDNCRVFSYGLTNFMFGTPLEVLLANSDQGFSIKKGNKRIIYYNENMPLSSIRFTLAHEIGHAVLGHRDEDDPAAEKEANCFARNLLCPLPTVKALNVKTESDYVSVFNISDLMAKVTVSRRSSDIYYIERKYSEIIENKLFAHNMGFDLMSEFERFMSA